MSSLPATASITFGSSGPGSAVHPEWLADRFLRAAATLDLPQAFGTFELAGAFAELRGWGSGEVRVFSVDGTYRVVPGNEPCGCDGAHEVDRSVPEGAVEVAL